jgi:choice-of-anchor B domain-containing protein
MKRLLFFAFIFPFLSSAQSSWNMNLLGTYDYPTTKGNDIWGWVDANQNEFAIVGLRNGVSCVNVTNPAAPFEEFFISDIYSIWRDVKTYGNYAYVTTESDAGLLIIDLTDMTGGTYWHITDFINPTTGVSLHWEAAHDLYIDENGVAYIFGASNPAGFPAPPNGAIFLDVATNPTNPTHLGQWNEQYIHDAMVRGDTMYAGCIYAGKVFIVDVSDKVNPVSLGSATTPNAFTHNAWVSDDGDYVFTTDEQSDAYLGAFDISNLNNIQEVDRIQSNPGSNSIPHNTFVDGNFLITSYYRDGTTVHDITHPNYMIQVGYYDSYTGSGSGYDGCWGTYPYLPSGNIISSDINSSSGQGRLLIYGRDFQQACYLQGNIYDGITGFPIANASVEILTTTTTESANLLGYYQSAIVSSGIYQLVFSAIGYTADTVTVLLNNGVMTIQNASLYPPCNTLNIIANQNVSICDNAIYLVGNSAYTSSGNYSDTLQTTFGCDSIVNTSLTVNPNVFIINYDTICEGQSIAVGISLYNQSGVYTDVLTSATACDSTITTYLFVKMNTALIQTISICHDEGVQVGVNYYNQNGTYIDVLSSQNGCDSTVTTTIIVIPDVTYSQSFSICNGESANVGQSVYTSVGIYTDVFSASNGCDSTVFSTILVLPNYSTTNNINLCAADSVVVGNNIYSVTGIYYDSLLTINLCDSIIITDLIVSDPIGNVTANGMQLNVSANAGSQPYVYEVFGPNGIILTSNNNNGGLLTINPTLNGQYYFIASDALGCITDTVYFTVDFATTIKENKATHTLLQITDVLGRKSTLIPNVPLFYHYDDGKVEKRVVIE